MKKAFVLLSVLLMSAATIYAKPLQLNLAKGQIYTMNTATTSTITQQVAGMSMEVGVTMNTDANFKVMQIVSDSIYKLEVTYTKFQFIIKSQFVNSEINSESVDANDKPSTFIKSMVNKPFYVSMTNKGNVLSVNADSLIKSISGQTADLSDAEKTSTLQQINQAFGNESIKSSLENYFSIYNGGMEKAGDTWTSSSKVKTSMQLDMTTTYKVASIENGVCTITSEAEVSATPDQTISENGMKMKYNINGTVEGSFKVDMKTGWIIDGIYNQSLKGQADIEANDQLPEGMSIPMTIITETKVSK